VRPFLALFLGTIVAIPIELRVFERRIDQQLHLQYRMDNKDQFDKLRRDHHKSSNGEPNYAPS